MRMLRGGGIMKTKRGMFADSVTGEKDLHFTLSPRQMELVAIHRKAFGKVYLIVKNGKAKLVNPDELVILE